MVTSSTLGQFSFFSLNSPIPTDQPIRSMKAKKSRLDLNSAEHTLGFVIGLNKSDFTYGWYGNVHGLHMYYNYFTDQGTFWVFVKRDG